MTRRHPFPPLLLLLCAAGAPALGQSPLVPPDPPPRAAVRTVSDTLHGLVVADPYRYMEDGSDTSARAWLLAQGAHARRALDAIPERAAILARVQELDASEPASPSGRPVLLRVTESAGNLWMTGRSEDNEDAADIYAFVLWQIRMPQHVSLNHED